ncbi:hypothetical protein [Gilliamella sp. W8136]
MLSQDRVFDIHFQCHYHYFFLAITRFQVLFY